MKLTRIFSRIFTKPDQTQKATSEGLHKACVDKSVTELFEEVLIGLGLQPLRTEVSLELPSGIHLEPVFLASYALDNGSIRTTSHVVARHPVFFSQGVIEFQHSVGTTVENSLAIGFSNWAKMDLLALEDAVLPIPRKCTFMSMEFPLPENAAPRMRQIILGPIAHLATSQAAQAADEEHPFCPCCLFTNSIEAFRSILESDAFVGIRLFASKDFEGKIATDCRVNGEDFSAALAHLVAYVNTWPIRPGLEYRKQYVVIRSAPLE